jgi:hypothetical protein
VEVCLRRILLVLVGVPIDLRFSSSATVDDLVCSSFVALARRLLICIAHQTLLYMMPGSSEGGARRRAFGSLECM